MWRWHMANAEHEPITAVWDPRPLNFLVFRHQSTGREKLATFSAFWNAENHGLYFVMSPNLRTSPVTTLVFSSSIEQRSWSIIRPSPRIIVKNKQTRLPSNLRPTTRECVHLATRGQSLPVTWQTQRWRSHHLIRRIQKPHAACKSYGSILRPLEFLHCGNGEGIFDLLAPAT